MIASLSHSIRIGPHVLRDPVLLAPMTGVSDLPFRKLAHELGAGLVVSEMVAGDELARQKVVALRKTLGRDLRPFCIQLIGSMPEWMAQGARVAQDLGADIIDINMGCPTREVTGKASGSALMRDLDHAERLIRAVTDAVQVPVTLKMRLGWDNNSRNAPELARRAANAGVVMVTVHGRTRNQFFKGEADWARVRDVVAAVSIPVVVNGDIRSTDGAARALALSGAKGVMIGRGAYGQPWLPGQVAAALRSGRDLGAPSLDRQGEIASLHVEAMLSHYGTELGLKNARKHIGWYLESSGQPAEVVKEWRRRLCTEDNHRQVRRMLQDFYGQLQEAA